MRNRLFPLIGIGCGILAIIFAVVVFSGGGSGVGDMDTGTYTSYNYYGGDAYTGIQQAAADTSRNVQALSRIVRTGFKGVSGAGLGYLLLIVGFGLIVYSLHTLNEMKARDNFEKQVLDALTGRYDGGDKAAAGYSEPEAEYTWAEPEEEPAEEPVEEYAEKASEQETEPEEEPADVPGEETAGEEPEQEAEPEPAQGQ